MLYVLAAVKAATDSRGALTPRNVHRTLLGAPLSLHPQPQSIGSLGTACCGRVANINKAPGVKRHRGPKMAATYSPTTRSTIGDAELNDPVRNGKGWDLSAITT